ncbi:hypothetical protein AXF42_Ash017491 [Apostasia shenzhenica]|uniref:RING-CH-type domain-containing protein n=1 Tax=Apostasia shenzhenica TaxID=1088818 RepID=A0A2H9ZZ89_9ASPA|nr:hypothetical protein AXF42_Ash017491 [Apostasia shenzhenica]
MAPEGGQPSIAPESRICVTSPAYKNEDSSSCLSPSSVASSEEESCRNSSISDCSLIKLGFEVIIEKADEKKCRICYMDLESEQSQELGIQIALGCSCKGDLAAAHMQCAETWFKLKGSKNCEICGSIVKNLAVDAEIIFIDHISNELDNDASSLRAKIRTFCHGYRLISFLLATVLFILIICWLVDSRLPH